jgi:hypothetical protein
MSMRCQSLCRLNGSAAAALSAIDVCDAMKRIGLLGSRSLPDELNVRGHTLDLPEFQVRFGSSNASVAAIVP